MLRYTKYLLFCLLFSYSTYAETTDISRKHNVQIPTSPINIDDIAPLNSPSTQCSSKIFSDALANNVSNISENALEEDVEKWIYTTIYTTDTLTNILQCPEFKQANDTDTIKFSPIEYTFPNGRNLVLNYETQPKVIKRHLQILNKRSINDLSNASPKIGGDDVVWSNTNPAWYGIMVTEAGALHDFVGPDKNNTISLKYIEANIDNLFPRDHSLPGLPNCTSKSAIAEDSDILNKSVRVTVGLEEAGEEDSNDYYVAGDINLEWVGWAEIALDVAITVVTMGGSQAATASIKMARAVKTSRQLVSNINRLKQSEQVLKFIKISSKIDKVTDEIKTIDKLADTTKKIQKLEKAKKTKKNTAELEKLYKEYDNGLKEIGKTDPERKLNIDFDAIKKNKSDEITNLNKETKELRKNKDVVDFETQSNQLSELGKYRRNLKAIRNMPKRGNVWVRGQKVAKNTFKTFKAINSGNKVLNKASKIARAGMKSGKVKDWLFHKSLLLASRVTQVATKAGFFYGVISVIGDMYDFTSSSTDEYTNGIGFKPLLLLSADDISGQENVVNYGMWLMWAGDSFSAEDDDAAYLQAFDFAHKAVTDLNEIQDELGHATCQLDFYVVRPVIRNPGETNEELYYLIMNDEPWTTLTE